MAVVGKRSLPGDSKKSEAGEGNQTKTHRFAGAIMTYDESERLVEFYDSFVVRAKGPDALDEHLQGERVGDGIFRERRVFAGTRKPFPAQQTHLVNAAHFAELLARAKGGERFRRSLSPMITCESVNILHQVMPAHLSDIKDKYALLK